MEVSSDPKPNEVLEEHHYYPFGMSLEGEWLRGAGRENRCRFNGKELNEDFGLGWYDYGARWYDAAIGRWNAVDPLAEDYIAWSPYNYVMENPISSVDPDGMRVDNIIIRERDPQGNVTLELDYRQDGELYDSNGNLYEGGSAYMGCGSILM